MQNIICSSIYVRIRVDIPIVELSYKHIDAMCNSLAWKHDIRGTSGPFQCETNPHLGSIVWPFWKPMLLKVYVKVTSLLIIITILSTTTT